VAVFVFLPAVVLFFSLQGDETRTRMPTPRRLPLNACPLGCASIVFSLESPSTSFSILRSLDPDRIRFASHRFCRLDPVDHKRFCPCFSSLNSPMYNLPNAVPFPRIRIAFPERFGRMPPASLGSRIELPKKLPSWIGLVPRNLLPFSAVK